MAKELKSGGFRSSVFVRPADRLFMAVRPFAGKYAARRADAFSALDALQREKMPDSFVYRPLNAEIEITSVCNQRCPHCGMAAGKTPPAAYSASELAGLADQLAENGIASMSITGGEPFLEFESMLAMLRAAQGRVDVCKLTSNGFWGKDAEEVLDRLADAGLLKNRFLVPCLMISIGEQSTPMEDCCAIFHAAVRRFSPKELTLCLSSLTVYDEEADGGGSGASKVQSFLETYEELYGPVPQGRIYLTENVYRKSSSAAISVSEPKRSVAMYMAGPVRCFEPTIGRYVLPRMLFKADGSVATCACFNPPDELRIGNVREEPVSAVLEKINASPWVRIIAQNGLHAFGQWIDIDECRHVPCANECDACRYLIARAKELGVRPDSPPAGGRKD